MESFETLNQYWHASNYIAACELYLKDNVLLQSPLKREHIKNKVVGHWGTVPGQNFVYTHLNRLVNKYDLDMMYVTGPGHGGNFLVAQTYLEGTYSEMYPEMSQDKEGLQKLCKSFSFPGGIGSHATPEVPGSISEGGELGYSLAHAFGAVLDHPNLVACCVIGDGEAETGPLATSWHGNKFINPLKDGIVLPVLHLNGYKISNPTVLSRMTNAQLTSYFQGLGYKPIFVCGSDEMQMHELMANSLDACIEAISAIREALKENPNTKFFYPMIVLRTPKGWGCPKEVKELQVEGTFRAHQVPVTIETDKDVKLLEKWLKSYHPEELFHEDGTLVEELVHFHPEGKKRIGMNPVTNGGLLRKSLVLPKLSDYLIDIEGHGKTQAQDMLVLSNYMKALYELNPTNYRLFCPDEGMSNRLYHVFEATKRNWQMDILDTDENLSKEGRFHDSFLSEHLCEGMLEGYILSGRHGSFVTYESFARVVDSMMSQHLKWLKMASEISWRRDVSSLNVICASHVWQQDHNGYTHQDPGLLSHLYDKRKELVNLYLPVDSNTLVATYEQALQEKNCLNEIVASKHPTYQWLSKEEAISHVQRGLSIWGWASTEIDKPNVILACAGDTPTVEALACMSILKKKMPSLQVRFININNLMTLSMGNKHSISQDEMERLFPKDVPIVFNFHGYPSLIQSIFFTRGYTNIKVNGYQEEGSITTSFDMRVRNHIDRYHLVMDILHVCGKTNQESLLLVQDLESKLVTHESYIRENGIDTKEIREWKWED